MAPTFFGKPIAVGHPQALLLLAFRKWIGQVIYYYAIISTLPNGMVQVFDPDSHFAKTGHLME
ncbi:hypothetical protein [Spirosoma endbachense]|uniref:Uncharacterized protein n=1 Tax=Spirosoma endbachense TaxID=2666025 RepID=A0A6P1W0U7_9BACT|nr:hypothetical protein [Spirosoma endbachense]QHV97620.1 hypothetical protein GJR95_22575 [Spirosoma endbachense]